MQKCFGSSRITFRWGRIPDFILNFPLLNFSQFEMRNSPLFMAHDYFQSTILSCHFNIFFKKYANIIQFLKFSYENFQNLSKNSQPSDWSASGHSTMPTLNVNSRNVFMRTPMLGPKFVVFEQ